MRIRHRNWSFMFLVSVVLVGTTQPIFAADGDDSALTPEELCAIFPEDQGFRPAPLLAANACVVQLGDCNSAETTGDCFQARITALASPEAARVIGYPGGHVEDYPDTFRALFAEVYADVAAGGPSAQDRR